MQAFPARGTRRSRRGCGVRRRLAAQQIVTATRHGCWFPRRNPQGVAVAWAGSSGISWCEQRL